MILTCVNFRDLCVQWPMHVSDVNIKVVTTVAIVPAFHPQQKYTFKVVNQY